MSMTRSERRLLWGALYDLDVDDVLRNLTVSFRRQGIQNCVLAEGLGR